MAVHIIQIVALELSRWYQIHQSVGRGHYHYESHKNGFPVISVYIDQYTKQRFRY